MYKTLALFLLGSLPLACADTTTSAPPSFVVAEFDPAVSPPRVPTPTDLARDPTTGRITVPLASDASQAERDFAAYLESLDAFPPASHATARFSAALAPGSVRSDTVIVVDVSIGSVIEDATVEFDAETLQLTVLPRKAWPAGHTIAIAVRGYGSGVRGADGRDVVAAPAFFFARSTRPISNCIAPGAGCTSLNALIPVDQAIGLEGLRRGLAPLFMALESRGIPRDEVAVAWSFGISRRPFTVFDPAIARIPFPNDVLRDQTTGRVNLPVDPDAPVAMNRLLGELNQLTGFSTTARVKAEIDLAPGDALASSTAGVLSTILDSTITVGVNTVVITPNHPLGEKAQYLVALTRELKDMSGVAVEPAPLMVFVRGRAPLVDGSRSTVAELTDSQAIQLEPLRLALGHALDLLGIPREDVVLAWGFTTQPTVSVLADRIAALPAPSSMASAMPIPSGVPHEHLSQAMIGTFIGSKGLPVPTILTLPTVTPTGIVIFQHGLGSDKTAVFAVADTFAQLGLATASMDLPLFGARAVDGHEFLDFNDLGAVRENLLEGAADLAQLDRTLRSPGLFGHSFAAPPIFVGVSIGGLVGTDFASLRQPARSVLSTTGAPLVDVALTSPMFAPRVAETLAAIGIVPGTPQFDQFVDFARWELDAGDPISYAAELHHGGSPVLVQIGGADQVTPPASGQKLAAGVQAQISIVPNGGHAMLINPQDPAIAAAQAQVVHFLMGDEP